MTRRRGAPDPWPPIFVVGVPRSGTTLLAAMLGAHSRLGCGPETAFFNELARADARRLLDRRRWPGAAVEFLFSMRLGGEAVPRRYGMSRGVIASYLNDRRPSIPAILSALTEQYARRIGRVRWIEKSPSHLLRTAEIRRHYPDSPILRIVRDPRGVALSLMKVPWGVKAFAEGLLYWREFDAGGAAFFARDPRSLTIRYEDLLRESTAVLSRVCDFIGERFEAGMLDTSESSAHVRRSDEVWKEKVGSGIDPGRALAWHSTLDEADLRLAEAVVGDRLRAYGYPIGAAEARSRRYVRVYPLRREAALAADVIARLVEDGARFWPVAAGEAPKAEVYCSDPGSSSWVGHRTGERAARSCLVAARIVWARLRGRPMAWAARPADRRGSGRCAGLLARMLASSPGSPVGAGVER